MEEGIDEIDVKKRGGFFKHQYAPRRMSRLDILASKNPDIEIPPNYINSYRLSQSNDNPKSQKDTFKSVSRDFGLLTTAHGLGRIAAAERSVPRAVWTLLFLVCFGYFIYSATVLLQDYFEYPVIMSIRVINQKNQMFPAITVCNQNRIMKSKVNGTRFEDLPNIDNLFCACRLFGQVSQHLGRRKKRDLPWWFDFDSGALSEEQILKCSHTRLDFNELPMDVIYKYKNRFRREINRFEEDLYNFGHNLNEYKELDILSEFHWHIVSPGRGEIKNLKKRSASSYGNLITKTAELIGTIDWSDGLNSN